MESEFHCVFPFWLGFYEELPNWKILWRRIFSVEPTLGLIFFFFFWGMGNKRKRIEFFVVSDFISIKK